MTVEAFLGELNARRIRLEPLPNGNLYAAPKERLTAELIEQIRQHKPALLAHFHAKRQCVLADEALALLRRLKCFTLPAGRMPAAREIAERCTARLVLWDNGEPVSEADDPASVRAPPSYGATCRRGPPAFEVPAGRALCALRRPLPAVSGSGA